METDPLEPFFDQSAELKGELREHLAKMLIPFAAGNPVDGSIQVKDAWLALETKKQVLVILMGRLALSEKNPDIGASLSPKEIVELTGLPAGTVRPKLSQLYKEHILHKDSYGNYEMKVSKVGIENAKNLLADDVRKLAAAQEAGTNV